MSNAAEDFMDGLAGPLAPVGDGGRGAGGRFVAGNRAAVGNPHARAVGQLRVALLAAVTPEDIRLIVAAMVVKAKGGDIAAAREVFDRTLGRPVETDLIERLEVAEAAINARTAKMGRTSMQDTLACNGEEG